MNKLIVLFLCALARAIAAQEETSNTICDTSTLAPSCDINGFIDLCYDQLKAFEGLNMPELNIYHTTDMKITVTTSKGYGFAGGEINNVAFCPDSHSVSIEFRFKDAIVEGDAEIWMQHNNSTINAKICLAFGHITINLNTTMTNGSSNDSNYCVVSDFKLDMDLDLKSVKVEGSSDDKHINAIIKKNVKLCAKQVNESLYPVACFAYPSIVVNAMPKKCAYLVDL